MDFWLQLIFVCNYKTKLRNKKLQPENVDEKLNLNTLSIFGNSIPFAFFGEKYILMHFYVEIAQKKTGNRMLGIKIAMKVETYIFFTHKPNLISQCSA